MDFCPSEGIIMFFVVMCGVEYESSYGTGVLIEGPDDKDLETLYNAWFTSEVLDVVGRSPQGAAVPADIQREYALKLGAHKHQMCVEMGIDPASSWQEMFVQVLILEHDFKKHQFKQLDLYLET
jgi:hypothetical protein